MFEKVIECIGFARLSSREGFTLSWRLLHVKWTP